MTQPSIDVVADLDAFLGECPVWCPDQQVLYWEDIDGRAIHRHDPSTGENTSRSLPGRPGSFVLTDRPGVLLVATEHELVYFDWESGAVEPWVTVEDPGTGNRLNDGRCDPAGRYVVGSMWHDASAGQSTGLLHRIAADGSTETLRSDVGVTNGIAFDAERSRMYFADTPTQTVLMWDYDIDTGERRNERPFFDYSTVPGLPDGACVDADGCYWSASVLGFAVIRITPDGVVDRSIEVPLERPTMPAFGGSDLSTMYVTSIRASDGSVSAPSRGSMAPGSVLAIDVGVQGVPETPFVRAD